MVETIDKRLAYIVANFPCYSETFILNELLELKKRGYSITILSLKKPKEKIVQSEAIGFLEDTFYCPIFLKFQLWVAQLYFLISRPNIYLGLLLDIARHCLKNPIVLLKNLVIFPKSVYFAFYIRTKGINHIHAHFANYPATSAMIASRLLNIPFSLTCHAHDIFYDSTMLDLKIMYSKVCFAISEYNRNYIMSIYPDLPKEKIRVIHCGVDLEKFSIIRESNENYKLMILSVGRLVPTKGFDDLLQACRVLKDKSIDFACKIVGEGPSEKSLKVLVEKYGLEDVIKFAGPLSQEDIIKIYREADIFILPAKKAKYRDVQDGIPLVLMEAMALRVPVISTRFSGIPELIDDGKSGFLVEPDDYSKLAEKVLLLNNDIELRKRLIQDAYNKIAAEFDIRKSVDKLLQDIFCG